MLRKFRKMTAALLVLLLVSTTHAVARERRPVDPLLAKVDESDAQRFAKLWRNTGGKPTAAQIQRNYLDHAGHAVEVFTPGRIGSAQHLAEKIAQNPALYGDAVERCLPWLTRTNAELRATYLGMRGLLPLRELPRIAVVVGANNSGGTAAPGIQVIGLEVICRLSPTEEAFDARMRQFFAHETVHTFQPGEQDSAAAGLLGAALREGVPDYVTELVTGRVPNLDRDVWARGREAQIWKDFQADAAIVRAGTGADGNLTPAAQAAFRRWFANAGSPPTGWPDELGYWVGMRIAEAYVAAAENPHRAIDELIEAQDPAGILRKSGYGEKFTR
jgi:hypothetical protein